MKIEVTFEQVDMSLSDVETAFFTRQLQAIYFDFIPYTQPVDYSHLRKSGKLRL